MRVREYSIVSSTTSNGIPQEVRYLDQSRVELLAFRYAILVSRQSSFYSFYWVDAKGWPRMAVILSSEGKIVLALLENQCRDIVEMKAAEKFLVKTMELDKPRA